MGWWDSDTASILISGEKSPMGGEEETTNHMPIPMLEEPWKRAVSLGSLSVF